jgi:hypothetical protein
VFHEAPASAGLDGFVELEEMCFLGSILLIFLLKSYICRPYPTSVAGAGGVYEVPIPSSPHKTTCHFKLLSEIPARSWNPARPLQKLWTTVPTGNGEGKYKTPIEEVPENE